MLVLDPTVSILSSVCKEIKIQHMYLIFEVVLASLQRREVVIVILQREERRKSFCSVTAKCRVNVVEGAYVDPRDPLQDNVTMGSVMLIIYSSPHRPISKSKLFR